MAKNIEQELKALRQRVRQLEGGSARKTINEIVGKEEDDPEPSGFARAVRAADDERREANADAAMRYLEKHGGRAFEGNNAYERFAMKFDLDIYTAQGMLQAFRKAGASEE